MVSWTVNLLGMIFGFLGAWLLYKGSPRDTMDLPFETKYSSVDYALGDPVGKANKEIESFNKRNKNSKRGFGLVAAGFLLQVIGSILQLLKF